MPTYNHRVTNGKLPSSVSAEIKAFIEGNEGRYITITLERSKTKRSHPQNKFYWSAVVPIIRQGLKDLGYTMTLEESHDFLKDKFLRQELVNQDTGEVLGTRTRSTTELSKVEMVEYIDNIMEFSATILGIVIPPPEHQTTIEL